MTLRRFGDAIPQIADSAWVDETALIVGDVTIGAESSVWPTCVIRGDVHRIHIGARSNIQDGTIIHVTHDGRFSPGGRPTHIGDDVTVGHKAVLHACAVEDLVLVGMNVTILDGAVIQSRTMIGAGSLVPPGKVLESGYLYVGNPVQRRRLLKASELEFLEYSAHNYVRLMLRHKANEG